MVDEESRVVAGFEAVWVPVRMTAVVDAEVDASEIRRATLCSTPELIDPANPSLLVGEGSSGRRGLFRGRRW